MKSLRMLECGCGGVEVYFCDATVLAERRFEWK